jgi:nicotinamidase-related amidase
MEFITKNPALLLIDIQKAFLDKDYPGGKRNNLDAELICGKILERWRELGLNVIHVRHSSINPDSKLHESKPGFEFNDFVKPKGGEKVLTKKVNSAFIGTGLNEILKDLNINTLVVVGMTTNHCISTSVRMAGNLGYETYLISDSTACYNTVGLDGKEIDCEVIYESSMASLKNEFASILKSEELLNLVG